MLVGELGVGLGLYPAWVGLLLGAACLLLILRFGGQVIPDHAPRASAPDPSPAEDGVLGR